MNSKDISESLSNIENSFNNVKDDLTLYTDVSDNEMLDLSEDGNVKDDFEGLISSIYLECKNLNIDISPSTHK